jgi:glycosyltransferase involved in cell wall biosynthesis
VSSLGASSSDSSTPRGALERGVLVACPDARPPAYQAVVGLSEAGLLADFLTSFYYRGSSSALDVTRKVAPGASARAERWLHRRYHPQIPADRVQGHASVDLAIALENTLARRFPSAQWAVARSRTRAFDRSLARWIARRRPGCALVFSDVGSEFALPACRAHGVPALLSMVHGDVDEERAILERERETAPAFFPIYLADGPIDERALSWLHRRRLRDLEHADRVLVPSEHIAARLAARGLDRGRIQVIPYAADCRRFVPRPERRDTAGACTFLFAGGITQRKGISYLLEAWRTVRRPGWRLQLLGGLPVDPAPLEPYRDEVEWLGRVGHAEMAAHLAAADVFVFPSLFEGSAVVTYEALACGLPLVATAAAGSVARDGIEGLIVPSADSAALARAMEALGTDPERRQAMARAARERALLFDWPRYHAAIAGAVRLAGEAPLPPTVEG